MQLSLVFAERAEKNKDGTIDVKRIGNGRAVADASGVGIVGVHVLAFVLTEVGDGDSVNWKIYLRGADGKRFTETKGTLKLNGKAGQLLMVRGKFDTVTATVGSWEVWVELGKKSAYLPFEMCRRS